ncbi:MAG: hypothetical protein ACRC4T_16480 [Cetobacterium sp.]
MEGLIMILDEIKAKNYKCIIDYETIEKQREMSGAPKRTLWREAIKWDMTDEFLMVNCRTEISNILYNIRECDIDVQLTKEKELLEFIKNYLNS